MRRNPIYSLVFFLFSLNLVGQNQLSISRIDQMPDLPTPYLMRDWHQVAVRYDSLVFSIEATGEHFPLVSLSNESVNYPGIGSILLDSYVGGTGGEAINIIPAIVGATLVGVDKSNHNSVNWVDRVKNFYNLKNGELIYLNGASESTGHDWWYETMPNVFFYQLYTQYPEITDFDTQFKTIADRWLSAVQAMGGSTTPWQVPMMNYRAWNLKQMVPLEGGVVEPESAGAIAWILYQAYHELGDKKYLIGAQQAMEFLNNYQGNPSYELQLSYGVLTAARMNAELGTTYDLQKLLDWCFDRGELRGWGSIVGTWDGKNVSGLIGEANDQGDDYAFLMNGLQQASTLVPLVKYDKRYAVAIGKWVLNLANASRLFYSGYIDPSHQSDYTWSSTHDPHSVIAYESLKEKWTGLGLYARGDAKDAGWAPTNLGLYGSSHVGYLGAVVQTTNVEGILLLDANATDFYGSKAFPTYLIYNPYAVEKTITLKVGTNSVDIYDAISESFIASGVSGDASVSLPGNGARLLTYLPSGSATTIKQKKLWVGDEVLDYHYGYNFSCALRIRSLTPGQPIGELEVENTLYCSVDSETDPMYAWFVDGIQQGSTLSSFAWTPDAVGTFWVKVQATTGSTSASDSLQMGVLSLIPENPVIDSLWSDQLWYFAGTEAWIKSITHDPKGLTTTNSWKLNQGQILEDKTDSVRILVPNAEGIYPVTLTVTNSYDSTTTSILQLLVKEPTTAIEPLIYFPFDGEISDHSASKFDVTVQNTAFGADSRDMPNTALSISNAADEVVIPNATELNFSEALTVSFWVNSTDFSEERFVISHGSWEQRWKASITMDKRLRWTVNTKDGIKDLDSSFPLLKNAWYHFTAIYSGYSMELYVNGILDGFIPHSGVINKAITGLTIGKRLTGDSKYYLKGRVDEVKVFNQAVGPEQALELSNQWSNLLSSTNDGSSLQVFPNPVNGTLYLQSKDPFETVYLMNVSGKVVKIYRNSAKGRGLHEINLEGQSSGVYFLQVNQQRSFRVVRIVVN